MILSGHSPGRLAAALVAASAILAVPPIPPAARAAGRPARDRLADELTITRDKGVATLVVFTSNDAPVSVRLASDLVAGPWGKANRGLVRVLHVTNESDPDFVKASGVTWFPTISVYCKGARGVDLLGTITSVETSDALTERLSSYGVSCAAASPPPAPGVTAAADHADAAVSQANFHADAPVHASTQTPPAPSLPAPPAAQPPAPVPAPIPTPVATPTPVPVTGYAPAGLIQVPGPNLVISQAPPQVYLAPTQAPIVYLPQMMAPAAAPPPAAPPMGNLFLPAVVAPPQPVAVTPPAASAPPVAAAGPVAVTNQTLAMPTVGNTTRVRVRGPGLIASGLASLGERMTRLGRARIVTTQSTDLQSPYAQTAGAGLTTISTTAAAPVAPPTMMLAPPPAAAPPAAPPPAEAPPARPTPQTAPARHSWFGHK